MSDISVIEISVEAKVGEHKGNLGVTEVLRGRTFEREWSDKLNCVTGTANLSNQCEEKPLSITSSSVRLSSHSSFFFLVHVYGRKLTRTNFRRVNERVPHGDFQERHFSQYRICRRPKLDPR